MTVDAHNPSFLSSVDSSRTSSRKGRRWLAFALGLGLAVIALPIASPVAHAAKKAAKPSVSSMSCELWAVHASKRKAKQRIPSNLASLRPELTDDQFAAFSSFELLERKSLRVNANQTSAQRFRAGYQMKLGLVDSKGKRLKVKVQLTKSPSSNLVNLDYWMNSGSLLMLVGGNYKDGKIVFATRCRAN